MLLLFVEMDGSRSKDRGGQGGKRLEGGRRERMCLHDAYVLFELMEAVGYGCVCSHPVHPRMEWEKKKKAGTSGREERGGRKRKQWEQ
jgi:hypothetical protein